ncbi:MAG: D-alanyl-D-alanine dipeptidase [Candidatus Hydrogenedentes bacterium]|nr:D-alanyl-D-alanine dipeptidase [Candidatus Hydrogenedentota bacterium]
MRSAPHADLVELVDVIPDIQLDIKYATSDNFTGKVVYPEARCFLVRDAAEALANVQADLHPLGYRLKVFDGYRPLSVQRIFWSILPDPAYVADPAKGSRHNRGYAVDLTLTDLQGKEVAMPSGYDDFSERAHRDYLALPAEAIGHRAILEQVMVRHGFIPFATEWWHFDFKGYEDKPNLDVPFDKL